MRRPPRAEHRPTWPLWAWPALTGLVLLAGCASFSDKTRSAREALDKGNPREALEEYNDALDVDSAQQLPKKLGKAGALLLMDRAMVLQQLGDYELSSRDLELADKSVEMLDFRRSTADEVGRYLFSDDVGPYKARPYEKLMINTMNMVNYLARDNLSGAKVEARRLAVMQEYLQNQAEGDPTRALLAPGSYLAGFVFHQTGEFGEALRYYDEALQQRGFASLVPAVQHAGQFDPYRTPRLEAALEEASGKPAQDGLGELLVVVNYGRVPALEAKRIPVGLALTAAGGHITAQQQSRVRRMQAQGLVTWVNYPTLGKARAQYPLPRVAVDGQARRVDEPVNVTALVEQAWEQGKGQVIASALTRMLARAAVGAGVGVGAAKASDKKAVGVLSALATQATMSIFDTPDTRSWATLPARVAFARLQLPAGEHRVRIDVLRDSVEKIVRIEEGGWAVVNATRLNR